MKHAFSKIETSTFPIYRYPIGIAVTLPDSGMSRSTKQTTAAAPVSLSGLDFASAANLADAIHANVGTKGRDDAARLSSSAYDKPSRSIVCVSVRGYMNSFMLECISNLVVTPADQTIADTPAFTALPRPRKE